MHVFEPCNRLDFDAWRSGLHAANEQKVETQAN